MRNKREREIERGDESVIRVARLGLVYFLAGLPDARLIPVRG